MTRLKSVFVMPFFAFQTLILVHAFVSLVRGGGSLAWFGPLVIAGSFFGFFGVVMLTGAARTSANLPLLVAASAVGAGLTLFGGRTDAGALPLFYASLGFLGTLLYVFWYSRFGRVHSSALEVGRILPSFELEDEEGGRQ